jgi:mycothiol synthase
MSNSHEHDVHIVTRDGVVVQLLTTASDLADALQILDDAERRAGLPLVDASERVRLERAVAHDGELDVHHHAVLARTQGACVGYAGLLIAQGEVHGVGDVAISPNQECGPEVLRALLDAVDEVARRHHAHGTQLWIRQAAASDLAVAVAAGHAVHRRLAVLGRRTTTADQLPLLRSDGVTVRAANATDDDAVVAVLAAAYDGSPNAGWDAARFAQATDNDWFRHADLLVAEDASGVLGVHWTKRRSPTTGEVHNLAVHPKASGRGLGRMLLDAGLHHLASTGCEDVLLWVDLANEAALRLYVTAGFEQRWEDVALLRHARHVPTHPHT